MKAFFWGMVIGSIITNAVWIFRAQIKAWITKRTPITEANEAIKK